MSLCVRDIFNTSFKNVKLLKFQLSKADVLKMVQSCMSHDLIGRLVQNITCTDQDVCGTTWKY